MDGTIREARSSDLPQIGAIWNHVIAHTTATFTTQVKDAADLARWYETRQAGNWPVLVIERSGVVAGFASCGPFRAGEGYAHVAEHSIYLGTEFAGGGLGSALLAALEEAARARGIAVLVAGISGENEGAIRFHARHLYVETGRMPDMGRKAGRRIPLVLMQKPLG